MNPLSQWQNLGNNGANPNKDKHCNAFGVNVTWSIKFVEKTIGHRYDKALHMWNFNIWLQNYSAHLQRRIWPHCTESTSRGRSFPIVQCRTTPSEQLWQSLHYITIHPVSIAVPSAGLQQGCISQHLLKVRYTSSTQGWHTNRQPYAHIYSYSTSSTSPSPRGSQKTWREPLWTWREYANSKQYAWNWTETSWYELSAVPLRYSLCCHDNDRVQTLRCLH